MSLKNKNLVSTQDWKKEELDQVLDLAIKLKKKPFNKNLANKTLFMVFFNPSLRTRSSFETAMNQSGGHAVNLAIGQGMWKLEHQEGTVMNGECAEHIKDAAKVLSRYGNAIGVRCFPELKNWKKEKNDSIIKGFAKHASTPVINMESTLYHPCQALADIMTVKEHLGKTKKKKFVLAWCYHPKALPTAVPNSAALIASRYGMDTTIACPKEFELDPSIIKSVKENCKLNGSKMEIVNDMDKALKGADIVYAKSWGSINYYGNWDEEKILRNKLKDWKITKQKMQLTNNAKFMHCLPVRRNVVVDDAVIDSKNSLVYDEAENRLHVQKALLNSIMR